MKKVLILGSGALKIGQAGEFDYSGSQAILALKEEGIKTILINPNIATIQTSKGLADKIYFLPISVDFVEKVIKKEKPQGILLSFGGQTALNCGIELEKNKILKKYNVKVLGTKISVIQNTEDRKLFVKKLNEIGIKSPVSIATHNLKETIVAAKKIGYPVMVRVAFALGGRGSGICKNQNDLIKKCQKVFSTSSQILVEEWLGGWKEIEYEVVRDKFDNCITVCNMENFDPLGIHTGESIVVAPSQTLTDKEYHKLREIAIKVIKHLGIIGECNIQYAMDPKSEDYRVIEVNARLSRSSALASKATGYPLAFIAAKLALGHSLTTIKNKITKKTFACFEPALDYIVVKMPRWDLKKFKRVDKRIGSEMKSVGEVMSIGRTFEEVIQKSLRMISTGMHGFVQNRITFKDIKKELLHPTDNRIFAIAEAFKQGFSVEKIYKNTKIDKWFLYKLQNIVNCEKDIYKKDLSKDLMLKAKQLGFSDYQISKIKNRTLMEIRYLRKKYGVIPYVKQIDTLAAEFPAKTNYLYLSYNGSTHDINSSQKSVIILGSGAYRIGSSVEFDWCCVNAAQTAKRLKFKTIMINYNPETVSTDYNICDRLYFEEITFERVMDIYEFEKDAGIIVSMGGQIANNLSVRLFKQGVKIFGTSALNIDRAENRYKFSQMLGRMKVDQPVWKELTTLKDAKIFANKIKYPVLIRPSYVLSGASMNVVSNDKDLVKFLKEAEDINPQHPVIISKFIENCKEIEFDGVAKNGEIIIYALSEHIERAGVHSGDATMVLPPQRIYVATCRKIKKISKKIAKDLNITGPFNIQFLAKENMIKVIECNLRASRSFPFCSKVFKQNMIEIATKVMLGRRLRKIKNSSFDLDYVGIKASQFSFSRLKKADPNLSVEMASTGEVGCLGVSFDEAFLKAFLSVGFKIPKKGILISIETTKDRASFLSAATGLNDLKIPIYGTYNTVKFLEENGIIINLLNNISDKKDPNVKSFIQEKRLDLVINISKSYSENILENHYLIRRMSIDYGVFLITNLQVAKKMIGALSSYREDKLEIKSWDSY